MHNASADYNCQAGGPIFVRAAILLFLLWRKVTLWCQGLLHVFHKHYASRCSFIFLHIALHAMKAMLDCVCRRDIWGAVDSGTANDFAVGPIFSFPVALQKRFLMAAQALVLVVLSSKAMPCNGVHMKVAMHAIIAIRLSLGAFGAPTRKDVNLYSNCKCLLETIDRPLPTGFRNVFC